MRTLRLEDALEELIDHRGKTPRKLGSEFIDEGVPVASAILVRDGRLVLDEARYVSEDVFERWMSVPLRSGDVILTSEAPLGRVARVVTDAPLVLGQRLFGLRGRKDVLDSGYLYYALQTHRVQADLIGRATGTTVVGIRQSALRQLEVPAPAYPQQVAIAEVLGALDDKIEANRKLAATADELCAAIVRESQDSNRAERLGDVAEIVMGSSPPGKTMNEDGEGVPFYQGVRDFGLRFPTRRVWTTAPTRTAHGGDILVSVRAPVGTVNYAPETLCIGRGLAAVRSRTDQQSTLFHLLRSVRRAWAEYDSGGTVFGSINRDQLHNIEIPAIRSDAVARCEAEVHSVEQRLASALRENESLAVLRDSVLPKLMSGQLRVAEAMEVVAL
ncbi:restriction endonuclease subunit S [Ruania albidiflava]|uniref:restriction endonuclease subunit S n=1 Tax=Ruania albidiflava TaxID=366586 RepID=UPI0003B3945A|nr:restriction endonuclease subunit S [Ruania albidiflava]